MLTWTITQYFHQNTKLEANPSVKTCVCKILKESPGWRQEHRAPRDRSQQKIFRVTRMSIFIQTLMEKSTRGSWTIQHRMSSRRARRSTKFTTKNCTVFVKDLVNIPSIFKITQPINERLLMASSWLTKDHEDFRRIAVGERFPRTKDLIQSVQRQVKIQIGRKDAYNMQISQDRTHFDCQEFRCWVIQQQNWWASMVTCSQNWTWSLESRSIQQLGNKIGRRIARTRICRTNEFGNARSAINLARLTGCFCTDIKKHIQKYLNGQLQNPLMRGSFSCPCSQKRWMDKERPYRNFSAQCERSDSICDPIQAKVTCASLGSRQKRGGTLMQRTSRNMWYCRIADGWRIQVSYFPPDISSDRAMIAWTVEERVKNLPFLGYIENKKTLIKNLIGKQFTMYV